MLSMIRRILLVLVLAFLLYAVITNPDEAVDIGRAAWDLVRAGWSSLREHIDQLVAAVR
ncbi:hypothetical protein [Ornithinimicrobium sufpigmenti]|uniref:hypothetical protein n=1 Tax=Ornithinimicrobium sufpigmenti TaxID=2508882 RepID=UPI0015E1B809|nr:MULTISPECIES: hypothetical protein [unclassified Ornithinimicrobium]